MEAEPELAGINTFLLVFFVSKLIFFLSVFGAFYLDLLQFATVVALSISLNRGVATAPAREPVLEPVSSATEEPPGALQPA